MDECIFYQENTSAARSAPKRRRHEEKGRSPYDGLRPWSAITHGVGAALAVVGTVLLLIRAAGRGLGAWAVTSFSIYGASMILLYTASTLYHCLKTPVRGRLALRKWDHCSIYFLIAGTYTPLCLLPLRSAGAWGWALFGVIWFLAVAGIVMTLFWVSVSLHGLAGCYRPLSPLAGAGGRRAFLAALRRGALHHRRRALRCEMAGAEQPPLWLPRDIPCVHPAWLDRPLYVDVPCGRHDVR